MVAERFQARIDAGVIIRQSSPLCSATLACRDRQDLDHVGRQLPDPLGRIDAEQHGARGHFDETSVAVGLPYPVGAHFDDVAKTLLALTQPFLRFVALGVVAGYAHQRHDLSAGIADRYEVG